MGLARLLCALLASVVLGPTNIFCHDGDYCCDIWYCDLWRRNTVQCVPRLVFNASQIHLSSQKYLWPYLQPPNSTAYEEDRDALTAQFDAAEALLREIQSESAAVRVAVEDQKAMIDKTTADVEAVVKEMRDGESRTRDELREIRDEVTNVREMLPKVNFFYYALLYPLTYVR